MGSQEPKFDLDKITPEQWANMGTTREEMKERLVEKDKREESAPDVGDTAPPFELDRLSDKGELTGEKVSLASLMDRPTALIFGSYT